jgi:hypothetical protein
LKRVIAALNTFQKFADKIVRHCVSNPPTPGSKA